MKDLVKSILESGTSQWEIENQKATGADFIQIDTENYIISFKLANDIKKDDEMNGSEVKIYDKIKDLKFGESFEDSINIWVKL